jgi:hypothetical protein
MASNSVVCDDEDHKRINEIGLEAFVRECEAGLWPPKELLTVSTCDPWPDPPKPEAFHGPLGEAVGIIAPESEADPIGIMASMIVTAGMYIGRTAFAQVEATRHHCNLNVVTVGESSKARKGTGNGQAHRLFRLFDERFNERIQSGLSSGEGLIAAVRDPVEKVKTIKGKKGEPDRQEIVIEDAGVTDKRILVLEPEFASVITVMSRETNILSSVLRNAWDSGHLSQMVKNNPMRATDAHVCILGNITTPELRKLLTDTDVSNGFANRFLWVAVKRSKFLLEGGNLRDDDLAEVAQKIADGIMFAQDVKHPVRRDDDAKELWASVYPELSEGAPGLYGSATSRAEAQVLRLSLIFALLDQSFYVRPVHLQAALAFWDYAARSARYIFGSALGDKTADPLLEMLKAAVPDGLTRTEMSMGFGRNKPATEIARGLSVLRQHGLAREGRRETGNGRPAEVWHYGDKPTSINGLPFAN